MVVPFCGTVLYELDPIFVIILLKWSIRQIYLLSSEDVLKKLAFKITAIVQTHLCIDTNISTDDESDCLWTV